MSQTKSTSELDLNFYPELKASTQARARYHDFPEEVITSSSLDELYAMIRDHELSMAIQAKEIAERAIKKRAYSFEAIEEEQKEQEEEIRERKNAKYLRAEYMSSRGVF